MNDAVFKGVEFDALKNEVGASSFTLAGLMQEAWLALPAPP
jgi:hypothetical protein